MEPIQIHAYVLKALDKAIDTGLFTYQEIADGTGVPKRTLEKIKRREIEDPGVSHVEKIANWFRDKERAAA
jgi:transcriptional regulator with XRE-family HTH domain